MQAHVETKESDKFDELVQLGDWLSAWVLYLIQKTGTAYGSENMEIVPHGPSYPSFNLQPSSHKYIALSTELPELPNSCRTTNLQNQI